jgi:hypothetical protein
MSGFPVFLCLWRIVLICVSIHSSPPSPFPSQTLSLFLHHSCFVSVASHLPIWLFLRLSLCVFAYLSPLLTLAPLLPISSLTRQSDIGMDLTQSYATGKVALLQYHAAAARKPREVSAPASARKLTQATQRASRYALFKRQTHTRNANCMYTNTAHTACSPLRAMRVGYRGANLGSLPGSRSQPTRVSLVLTEVRGHGGDSFLINHVLCRSHHDTQNTRVQIVSSQQRSRIIAKPPTHKQTHARTCTHTCTSAHTHTYMHMRNHAHTHTHAHTHKEMHTSARTQVRALAVQQHNYQLQQASTNKL